MKFSGIQIQNPILHYKSDVLERFCGIEQRLYDQSGKENHPTGAI